MRFVVLGAGAIGAPFAAWLQDAGREVVTVARGLHGRALRDGLDLRTPRDARRVPLTVFERTEDVRFRDTDVVVLAVMGQHTEMALQAVPSTLPVLSLQNGTGPLGCIEECGHPLLAGMVWIPAERRAPGRVALSGHPSPGRILIGPFAGAPSFVCSLAGVETVEQVEDVTPWVHAKTLVNLGGIVAALCDEPAPDVLQAARSEGRRVLEGLGHTVPTVQELLERVGRLTSVPVDGVERVGGSTRHALARGDALETPSLHGPIVEHGAALGLPCPVNQALITLANRAHAEGWPPGNLSRMGLRKAVGVG